MWRPSARPWWAARLSAAGMMWWRHRTLRRARQQSQNSMQVCSVMRLAVALDGCAENSRVQRRCCLCPPRCLLHVRGAFLKNCQPWSPQLHAETRSTLAL